MSKSHWTLSDMADASHEELAEESSDLYGELAPLLAGHDPRACGAALAECVAVLVAGHGPELREKMLELINQLIAKRIGPVVERMIKEGMCGPEWRGSIQ